MPNLKKSTIPLKAKIVYDAAFDKKERTFLYGQTVRALKHFTDVFPSVGIICIERDPWNPPTQEILVERMRKAVLKFTKNPHVLRMLNIEKRTHRDEDTGFGSKDACEALLLLENPKFYEYLRKDIVALLHEHIAELHSNKYAFTLLFTRKGIAAVPRFHEEIVDMRAGVIDTTRPNLQKVILHEVCHLFNAEHSTMEYSIMNEETLSLHDRICFLADERNAINDMIKKMA